MRAPRAKKLIIFQAIGIDERTYWPTTGTQKTKKIYRADFEQIEKTHFGPFRNVKPMATARAICTPFPKLPETAPPAHGRCRGGHPAHRSPSHYKHPSARNAMPKIHLMLKPMGLKHVHVPRARKIIIFLAEGVSW